MTSFSIGLWAFRCIVISSPLCAATYFSFSVSYFFCCLFCFNYIFTLDDFNSKKTSLTWFIFPVFVNLVAQPTKWEMSKKSRLYSNKIFSFIILERFGTETHFFKNTVCIIFLSFFLLDHFQNLTYVCRCQSKYTKFHEFMWNKL